MPDCCFLELTIFFLAAFVKKKEKSVLKFLPLGRRSADLRISPVCSRRSETGWGLSATSRHQQRCYIIPQKDFEELHLNLFYVTKNVEFLFPDEQQLFTTLFCFFFPILHHHHRRVGGKRLFCLEGELAALWWRAASVRDTAGFCTVRSKVCIVFDN